MSNHYPTPKHPNPLGGLYTCDRCDCVHEREFSLLCASCEAEVEDCVYEEDDGDSLTGRLVECNYCSEIALPFEGGECRECGSPQYF